MRALIYAASPRVDGSTSSTTTARDSRLPHYIAAQARLLAPYFDSIMLVSDAHIGPADRLPANCVVAPLPAGSAASAFDAYRVGFDAIGLDKLADFDSVSLLDASAFGPTADLPELLARMQREPVDIWGVCRVGAEPLAARAILNDDDGAAPLDSLHPFFTTYNERALQAPAFRTFFSDSVPQLAAASSSFEMQHQLSRALLDAGLSSGVAFVISDAELELSGSHNEPSAARPDVWAAKGIPFLLINDLLARPDFAPYGLDYLARGGYPAAVAAAELSQLDQADNPAFMWAKQRDYAREPRASVPGQLAGPIGSVAIHLHAHYPELVPGFLAAFRSYQFDFELFITTSEANVGVVEAQLAEAGLAGTVVPVANLGRDIYPLMLLRDQLSNFDIIGHFHTKQTKHDRAFVGQSWRDELFEMLVRPGDAILTDFVARPELGLVIADIPTYFRHNRSVTPEGESHLVPIMADLWARMELPRAIDFKARKTFVMSFGTFFWARREAIWPLLELDIADEIPPEPLKPNHTVLHALERLLVYVAWAQGYDFAISQNRYLTRFADEEPPVFIPLRKRARHAIGRHVSPELRNALRPIIGRG